MILGHASAAVTLGVYVHLWPGEDDRARGILDAALAGCVRTEERRCSANKLGGQKVRTPC
jgi:hypothetical protein